MKKLHLVLAIAMLTLGSSVAQTKYASPETQEVIEKMIQAYGGYEKWKNLETLTFTSSMQSKSLGFLRFWIKTQTIDMKTRRSYQDWPLVGSQIVYDGEKVWSTNWRLGNPPNHQYSVYYYYVNLPWLTQDNNVKLGKAEKIKHPAFKTEVYKIPMTFTESPTLGKSQNDTYTLYINASNYILDGYEYTVGYGPLLDQLKIPKDKTSFGPALRINTYTGDINVLKFPMLMTTNSLDLKDQYGDHAIYSFKMNDNFDESRMTMPANGVVDTSKDVRQ
jgi:outer membrane lipoprotein-sorting protein